jgi:adenosylhomocysteinase
MPGLMSIRKKYAAVDQAAGKGVRITGSLHMTIETAIADRDAGGTRRLGALGKLQYFFDPGPRRRGDCQGRRSGVRLEGRDAGRILGLHAGRAHSSRRTKGPQLIVDDGGDATLLIHKGYELGNGDDWVKTPSASTRRMSSKIFCKRVLKERPGLLASKS